MKKALSIAVVQVFLLNTLLSSQGFAGAALKFNHDTSEKESITIILEDGAKDVFTRAELKSAGINIDGTYRDKGGNPTLDGKTADQIIKDVTAVRAANKTALKLVPQQAAPPKTEEGKKPKAMFSMNSVANKIPTYLSNSPIYIRPQGAPSATPPPVSAGRNEPTVTQGATMSVSASIDETETKDGQKETKLTAQDVKVEAASEEVTKKIYEQYRPEVLRTMFKQEREELLKSIMQNMKHGRKMQRHQNTTQDWERTILGSQIRRFPMESVMFFFAIGLINGTMIMNDFAQNPLMMEQHFQTLVDPIGHLGFLSFMIVNGYTTEFLSNRMLAANLTKQIMQETVSSKMGQYMAASGGRFNPDDILKDSKKYADRIGALNPYQSSLAKRSYFSMIQYFGMTAGSMASHFTGDFLRTMQSCAKSFYKEPKKQNEQQGEGVSEQATKDPLMAAAGVGKAGGGVSVMKDRLNILNEDACEVAWREWTLEKKFNMYSPALMSMILSTAASGVVGTQLKRLQSSAFVTGRKEAFKKGYVATFKLVGVDYATSAVARVLGGWAGTTMKIAGHLFNITLFTALDTMMHSWVEDKVLNINYGTYSLFPNVDAFPKKAEILFNLVEKESKEKFSKDSVSCEKDIQSHDCRVNDIEGFLFNFSESMAKWREFNQTKAFQAHSAWMDKINKFQKMERFAYNFYRGFVLDLKQSRKCKDNYEICAGEFTGQELMDMERKGIDPTQYEDYTMATYRHYPLYGVEPVEDGTVDMKRWKDLYITSPDRLQTNQKIRVKAVAQALTGYLARYGMDSSSIKNDKPKFEFILKGLNSDDLYQNAQAINYMRSLTANGSTAASTVSQSIIRDHLNQLGYAAPLLNYGQGYTFAFELNTTFKDAVQEVELPDFYRNWTLNSNIHYAKKTDYLMFYMLCGPNADKNDTISHNKFLGMSGFRDLFLPPRIIDEKVSLDICGNDYTFGDTSKLYSQKIKDTSSGKEYSGAFHVLVDNVKPEIRGIIKSDKFDPTEEEKKNRAALLEQPLFSMEFWWEKNVEKKVQAQLDSFKKDYEEIAVKFLEAQFKGVGNLFGMPLNSEVVRNSVVVASMQESRTYALVMAEVIKSILTEAEYKAMLTDNKNLPGLSVKKMETNTDILSKQVLPYQQDLEAMKSGSAPKIFKFQELNEGILRDLYNLIKNAKVVSKKDEKGEDRNVVDLGVDRKTVEEMEKSTDEKIKALEESVQQIQQVIDGKLKATAIPNEKQKPQRILTFGTTQLAKIARELIGTVNTIRYAQYAAEDYSKKDLTKEEQLAKAERMKREENKRKCQDAKRAGTMTGGGC